MNPELPELTVSIINYRTAALTIQSAQSVLDDMQGRLRCRPHNVTPTSG